MAYRNVRERGPSSAGGRSSLFNNQDRPTQQQYYTASEDLLEQENERHVSDLQSKIGLLKSLTIDIGNEVRDQNRMLDNMDNEFGSAENLLKGTMQRLNKMIKSKSGRHMCYLMLFVVFVVVLVYFMTKK
mmetsp:Transcript_15187/g.26030  ORF Transcript_15187/g.26030 Transcript_15187/m.26030 type:complete len:130 (+) Transcript_15187:66-455(+)